MNNSNCFAILELHNPKIHSPFTAKKGDTGRTLQFMLTDNGETYPISSDCYAVFTAKKPDGSILYNSCEIENNIISYTFTLQTCSVSGEIPCEVKLYGADDKLITAPSFLLLVEDTIYSDGDLVESASEVSALTKLISDATSFITDVEQKLAGNAYADANSSVLFTGQTLTDTQKAQARTNIAAAPAGYGLGGSAKWKSVTVEEMMDDIVENGWYLIECPATTLNNVDFRYASLFVLNLQTNNGVFQELRPVDTNTILRRYRKSDGSTWSKWECENPPMALSAEYRTTEKSNNKPVYIKRVDCGALPASSSKVFAMEFLSGCSVVDFSATAYSSEGPVAQFPMFSMEGDLLARVNYTTNAFSIATFADVSQYNLYITVKYTKA